MSAKENNLEEKVKSLYEVMQQEKVEEIKINSDDMKLHIRRKNYSDLFKELHNLQHRMYLKKTQLHLNKKWLSVKVQ